MRQQIVEIKHKTNRIYTVQNLDILFISKLTQIFDTLAETPTKYGFQGNRNVFQFRGMYFYSVYIKIMKK